MSSLDTSIIGTTNFRCPESSAIQYTAIVTRHGKTEEDAYDQALLWALRLATERIDAEYNRITCEKPCEKNKGRQFGYATAEYNKLPWWSWLLHLGDKYSCKVSYTLRCSFSCDEPDVEIEA